MSPGDLRTILATDCGSTTTKAILIDRQGDEYRLTARGEAPTTVEAPAEDVTRGVVNAIAEIEDVTGRKFIKNDQIWTPREGENGCDAYVGTSSAGGGLQLMVTGVVKNMTAESAARAALGAGAIVVDTLAVNDGRKTHDRIDRIRRVRPDMILITGGTEGGTVRHVVEMAEVVAAADPRPRFGAGFKLPVIFAGNDQARAEVEQILSERSALTATENIRPRLEMENLRPARDKIHDLFLEHVMKQAPGYGKLMTWTTTPLMPTPGAVGLIMQRIADVENIQLVGVDIGGATTDVFSVFRADQADAASEKVFNRTVSANLGMSYSIFQVVADAGFENVVRWVPLDLDERDVRNRLRNKMIRPTTVPQTLEDLMIEQALCREALRLSFIQHCGMAVGLRGVRQERGMGDAFEQGARAKSLVDLMALDMLVGSGGVLSHSPRRVQAALMMIDAFAPEGFTELSVDSIFMMPQLGVLSTVSEKAALDVFRKDCLIRLGYCVAPRGTDPKASQSGDRPCMTVDFRAAGRTSRHELKLGQLKLVPHALGEKATVLVQPAKGFDIGAGPGKPVAREITGGVVGLILDARGRPFTLPQDRAARVAKLTDWNRSLDIYPQP